MSANLINIDSRGYGKIYKAVMRNRALPLLAKTIYAYFCAYAGNSTKAFPTNTYYKHLDQLVVHGYLFVEQRKNNGRFDVCTYRLNESIVQAGTAPPCKSKKGASEKLRHDKDDINIKNSSNRGEPEAPMSERVLCGGKHSGQSMGMSEKLISDEPTYEKTVPHNFGRASINNISTSNSYFITEQVYNHQLSPHQAEQKRLTLYSTADVKQRIGYDRLEDEVDGWGELLKITLGLLDTPEDEARYYRTMEEILNEIVLQLVDILNKSKVDAVLLAKIESDALALMFDDILARWDEIRNVHSYVAASLKNLLRI